MADRRRRRLAPGPAVTHHAIVLAGGRATRLGGIDKPLLRVDGRSLLDRTIAALPDARRIVVVGTAPEGPLPAHVHVTREDPPFAGPAAGIAAGLDALPTGPGWVLVLAGDMPHVARCVPSLLATAGRVPPHHDGTIAVDATGRTQPLAVCVLTARLRLVVDAIGDPTGLPARRLLAPLDLVHVPTGDTTADIDTPDQARRFGAVPPPPPGAPS